MTSRALYGLLLVLAMSMFASTSSAQEARYKVIAHPAVEVTAVSESFLRDAYLKKAVEWGSGETILPVDLAWKFEERRRFTEEILRKTPAQLKNYWNQQIFSGKGVPPPEAASVAAVVQYVLANPGAIGYVPANVDAGDAKVLVVQ